MLTASPKAMFSFLGFESIASLYSIVHRPRRNIVLASGIAVFCVGTLYVLFAFACLAAIPSHFFLNLSSQVTLSTILQEIFPDKSYLSHVLLIGGGFAIVGTLHSMVWSTGILFHDVLKKLQSPRLSQFVRSGMTTKTCSVWKKTASCYHYCSCFCSSSCSFSSTWIVRVFRRHHLP